MSNVNLTIGGRDYTVACAAGEESHVTALGALIDHKLREMGGAGQSESRALLFVALLLADELHELRATRAAERGATGAPDLIDAQRLTAIADRLEKLASTLEGAAASA
ncbi:MAG: cell division protein ZapA [Novosphingobium sp.]|nr:cell division protein ZapA [Novosphingobium sp.]